MHQKVADLSCQGGRRGKQRHFGNSFGNEKKMLAYALSKIFDNDKNVKMHFTGVSEQQGRFARRIVAREDSVRSTHSQCDEDEDDHDDDDDGHGNDDDDDSHMITCWKMVMTMICI